MADQAMRGWALKGAEQRLLEISEEAAAIYRAFPELRDRGVGTSGGRRLGPRRKDAEASATSTAPTRRRRKRTMSAEARKRISEAQKARWAKQKGAAETPASAPSAPAAKASRKSSPKKK